MNTTHAYSRYNHQYCDCPICNHTEKNEDESFTRTLLTYAAGGAGIAGMSLLKTNLALNSTLKALNKDTFDVAKDVKLLSTDYVKNQNIYEVVGGSKIPIAIDKSVSLAKESLVNMAQDTKTLLKKSAPKIILEYTGIAVGIGAVFGLIDRLCNRLSKTDSVPESYYD